MLFRSSVSGPAIASSTSPLRLLGLVASTTSTSLSGLTYSWRETQHNLALTASVLQSASNQANLVVAANVLSRRFSVQPALTAANLCSSWPVVHICADSARPRVSNWRQRRRRFGVAHCADQHTAEVGCAVLCVCCMFARLLQRWQLCADSRRRRSRFRDVVPRCL